MKLLIRIIVILSISSFTACVVDEKSLEKEEGSSDGASAPIPGNSTTRVVPVVETVQVKSFNQINMTMAKLTGVSRSEPVITNVISQILNQLPADNKLSGMTPFHQISITRLAFSYCNLFIDNDADFSAINYGSVSDQDLIDRLEARFLDFAPAEDPEIYDVLRAEIAGVLANAGTDSTGPLVEPSSGSVAEVKERLTKMSCTLILSSPFITLI